MEGPLLVQGAADWPESARGVYWPNGRRAGQIILSRVLLTRPADMTVASALRSVPLFAELRDTDLQLLAGLLRPRDYPKNRVILFSHAKNTTYHQLQFVRGRMVEVSKLDTSAFLLWALISTLASIAAPFQFEQYINGPGGTSIFPNRVDLYGTLRQVDFIRVPLEGSLVISVVGLVVYALQRLACLLTWMRSVSFAAVAALYLVFICELPILSGTLFLEIPELRSIPILAAWAPILASVSPFMVLNALLMGEMGSPFLSEISMVPFYIVHSLILILTILGIRRCGRNLRQMYLAMPVPEASNNLVTLQ